MKLKAQLHTHTKQDPRDNIKYSEYELIDRAAELGYEVLAITCHNVVIHNDRLSDYAKKKNILLIPGIEKDIEGKHVLILNATIEAQKIHTFSQLKNYKEKHSEALIIAPHPFFPGSVCLGKKLIEHIDLFDAIESNYYSSKLINCNKKAHKAAETHKKPLIGTADVHLLKYIDHTFSEIETTEKTIPAVIKAIKGNKITITHTPLKNRNLVSIISKICIKNLVKRVL